MPENPYRQVNGPQGPINFPSNMSDEQVTQAMRKLYPPKQAAPSAPSDAYADPTKSLLGKVGAFVPEALTSPLISKYAIEPFEKAAKWGGDLAARSTEPIEVTPGKGISGWRIAPEGTTQASHPITGGIEKGIARTVGSLVTDPRNWPMLGASAARPALQLLMSRGFTGMMAKGTYDAAKQLHDNWDKMSPTERAELGTQAGLSAVMTATAARHAVESKGAPAPRPEETPIAGSGVTEAEAKISSQRTGSSPTKPPFTYEELKARIAAIEERTKPKPVVPADITKGEVPKTLAEIPSVTKFFTPEKLDQISESLKSPADKPAAPKPIEAPPTIKEPSVQDRLTKIREQLEAKTKPVGEPDRPLDISERIFRRGQDLKAQGLAESDQLFRLMKDFPDQADQIAKSYGYKPSSSPEVGREAAPPEALKPEVKPVPSTQATSRSGEPVRPTAQSEIIQGNAPLESRPETSEERFERRRAEAHEAAVNDKRDFTPKPHGILDNRTFHDFVKGRTWKEIGQELVDKGFTVEKTGLDRHTKGSTASMTFVHPDGHKLVMSINQDGTVNGGVFSAGKEDARVIKAEGPKTIEGQSRPSSEPRSVRGDLGERPPTPSTPSDAPQPPPAKPAPRDFAKEMEVFKKRVEEYQAKNPGVAKTRAQEAVSEQMRKERGSLGGSPDDPKARREEKINEWIRQLKDPKSNPELIDTAWKQLNAYGVSPGEIIKRVGGGFPKNPHEDLAKAERERESLEERLGPNADLDKKADDLIGGLQDIADRVRKMYQEPDVDEGSSIGPSALRKLHEDTVNKVDDIPGIKSPAVEELDRIHALKDLRDQVEKKSREDERGSISFKRLSEEDRKAANPFRRLADALDRVANLVEHGRLSDEEIARDQQARNIMRGAIAGKARSHLEVMEALKEAIQRHDSPSNERDNFISFMDAGEGKPGAKFLNPEDQAMAQVLHEMFDERWEKIKEVKGLEGEGIENYLSHIWERPNKAYKTLAGLVSGRRPLEGSAKFLKNRFYQYASTGIEHGLTPATWNPIRLQLAALFDVDKFLMAHDIKDSFKGPGLVQWHTKYKDVPVGWQRLNDKIFQPRAVGEGALKEYGNYYAPPEVAKIFNNYLSPGLKGNFYYDALHTYGNLLNMANLGVSAYHGTMISLVSATSDVALGLQKTLNYGDAKGGIKDALRGSIGSFIFRSATQDYRLGREVQNEAINPTGNVELQKYVDAIVQGGGRFKQDPFYTKTIGERTGFGNWLRLAKEGKFAEMASTPVRKLSGPIMDKYVPRVKLGIASRMMEAKLADMHKNGISDENLIATEMGKIWNSVDNRAGQMVYDNLFWNKAGKDLSFLAVRAVGWDLGSVREYGGAVAIDLPRQAAKVLRGERPELTARLAFTIATPITIGLFGAMTHYIMTGKAPQKLEDYFFPGPDGAKISFPSYVKDILSFKNSPLQTGINKLHPTWSQLLQFHENTDFYGTEIQHEGDPFLKRGLDVLKWYGKTWEPYGYTGMMKRMERGESFTSAVTGLAGFMPAPQWVSQTKAEQLAVDLAQRNWKQGPRTTADTERYNLVQKFSQQVGSGQKVDPKELNQAWRDKKIQDSDLDRIYNSFKVPRLQREFKELNLPDALAVMREADPNERVQLKPLLLEKYNQLFRYPLDMQQVYDRQIKDYLQ